MSGLFKKRVKAGQAEQKEVQIIGAEAENDDPEEEEELVEAIKEHKRRHKFTSLDPSTLEGRSPDKGRPVFNTQEERDLSEYLTKRDEPSGPKKAETFDDKLDKFMKDGGKGKLSEIFARDHPNENELSEDFAKLGKVEEMSRQIKEEAKDRAYWSIGMIEVDIGMDRKIANIEATEQEKRNRLIQEYIKTNVVNNIKPGVVSKAAAVAEAKAPTEPITNWIWKPKDQYHNEKERERKELENLMKAFSRTGKVYKNKKLLGELGMNTQNIGKFDDEELDDD